MSSDASPWKVKPGFFGSSKENIHVIEDFIAPEDVSKISLFARSIKEWSNQEPASIYAEDGTCLYDANYWNDRQCGYDILQKINPEIYELIDSYIEKMGKVINETFNCVVSTRPPCIIRWFAGIQQEPHADKQLPDGSPNPFTDYDINALFYYNEDFTGGELYYPQHDMVIKPKPGLAVFHPGDINYLHGVSMVTSGERFTTPAFYTIEEFL